MPPKKRLPRAGDNPINNRKDFDDSLELIFVDDGDDIREARRYAMKRAKELGFGKAIPEIWDVDGTLVSGWDTSRRSDPPPPLFAEEPTDL